MTRVVCALSGGSAKGAAHVGAVKALEECDLRPAHYVGSSIGAVVAACFASGQPYADTLQRITTLTRRDVAALSPRLLLGPLATHLFQPGVWRETIAALVPARRFDELHTPLTVTAVDAQSGDLVLFGHGGRTDVPLVDALYASCALPLYFPPAEIKGRHYLDGGLRAVFPLDVAGQFQPDLLFGCNVGPVIHAEREVNASVSRSLLGSHRAAMRILMAAQVEEVVTRWSRERPDVFVLAQPGVDGHPSFEMHDVIQYVELGYRTARRALRGWMAR